MNVTVTPTTFTPAPWTARESEFYPTVEALQRPKSEARNGNTLIANICAINGKANARLIAAAPDLYQALRDVIANAPVEVSETEHGPLYGPISLAFVDSIRRGLVAMERVIGG